MVPLVGLGQVYSLSFHLARETSSSGLSTANKFTDALNSQCILAEAAFVTDFDGRIGFNGSYRSLNGS
jgi:hypothetical protein